MRVSVLIPTFNRHAKLGACLRALKSQSLDAADYEVLVGIDGHDTAAAEFAQQAWAGVHGRRLSILQCPRIGYTAVRNRLLSIARGRLMLSINDDVIPTPGFLASHIEAHEDAAERGINESRGVVVSGYSPWIVQQNDSLFDLLIRSSPMIFFLQEWDSEKSPKDPDRDWGFRHCYGLNFSAPMELVRSLGGFTVFPGWYGYEDIEMGFRLKERFGCPNLFRREAMAPHDHRVKPMEYLAREYTLGYTAWGFAGASPACAQAIFRRDIRCAAEIAYCAEFVRREREFACTIARRFISLTDIPADPTHEREKPAFLELLYQNHLPLKRWCWRRGLIDAAAGRVPDSASCIEELGAN